MVGGLDDLEGSFMALHSVLLGDNTEGTTLLGLRAILRALILFLFY